MASRAWLLASALLYGGCGGSEAWWEGGPELRPLVTDGHAAGEEELHATVALVRADNGALFCTGALVAEDAVVTAAHCVRVQDAQGFYVADKPVESMRVVHGALHTSFAEEGDGVDVAAVFTLDFDGVSHDDEGDPGGLGRAQDLAVMLLAEPITSRTPAVVLPAAELGAVLTPGALLTLAGFGHNQADRKGTYGRLNVAESPFVRRNDTEMLVGGEGEPDTCDGDSGGPAYLLDDEVVYLVGAASRGIDACGAGGIYTLVPAYEDWVHRRVNGLPDPECPDGCTMRPARAAGPGAVWVWVAATAMFVFCRRRRARSFHRGLDDPCR